MRLTVGEDAAVLDRPGSAPSATDPGRMERKRVRTRARLIDAAAAAFAAKSVEATTIADITEAADVGLGTFYNYFGSKDEIADAVTARMAALMCSDLRNAAHLHEDPAVALAALVHELFAWFEREPIWGPFLLTVGVGHEAVVREFGGLLLEVVLDGGRSGAFHSTHLELAVVAIAGTLVAALGFSRDQGAGSIIAPGTASHVLRLVGIDAEAADRIADRTAK